MGDIVDNNSQDLGISDAENAEIDAQINASYKTDSNVPSLEESYAEMIRLMNKRLSDGYLSESDKERYNSATQNFNTLFKQEIAKAKDIHFSHTDEVTGQYIDAEEALKQDILRNHPIAEHVDTVKERNIFITQKIIDNTPSLKGFTLDDAVNFAKGENDEMAVRLKFKDADPDILLAVAYTMLDAKQGELEKTHPDFAQDHKDTNFLEMVSTNVLYKIESNKDYQYWSDGKLEEIANAIANNPSISSKLAMIRSPDNIHSAHDIVEQYQIRQQLTDEIGEVYAKAYDLSNFGKDDIHFMYKSLDEYMGGAAQAVAYSTTPGVINDETIISSYHPIADLVRSRIQFSQTSDSNSAIIFLKTTLEELQHTTDNVYADKLINGELPETHPAFEHTSIHILNSMNYTESSENDAMYKAQYTERSAKTTADDMALEIMFNMEEKARIAAEQAPTTESQTSNITEDTIQLSPPIHTDFKF